MTDERATILDWTAEGALPRERLRDALRLAGAMPGPGEWRRFLETLFLWLGAASLAAAIGFFVAANWQTLGRFAKFGLVELAVVVAIGVALWRGIDTLAGRAALFVAAILAGVLLALVGQVYQTGADTFELFVAWALAIVVWVIVARQPALWILWVALLNLAVFFYYQRAPGFAVWALLGPQTVFVALFALDALALAAWEIAARRGAAGFAARWAPRTLALAAGVAITIVAVWSIFEARAFSALHLLAYALWLAALYWAYRVRRVDLFVLSGAVLSAVVVGAVGLARLIFGRETSDAFLLMSLAMIAGAAAGAWWLRRVAAEEDTR